MYKRQQWKSGHQSKCNTRERFVIRQPILIEISMDNDDNDNDDDNDENDDDCDC
jgi:hypothetical protein